MSNPLAKLPREELERAEEIYCVALAGTGDEKLARERWALALGLRPSGRKLLPPEVFERGVSALRAKLASQYPVERARLSKGVEAAVDLILNVVEEVKAKGLTAVDSSLMKKALETAKWLVDKEFGANRAPGGERAPTVQTNVQVNLQQGYLGEMSLDDAGKLAAQVLLDCRPARSGGADHVPAEGQGQGDRGAGSAAAERGADEAGEADP